MVRPVGKVLEAVGEAGGPFTARSMIGLLGCQVRRRRCSSEVCRDVSV